MTAEERADEIMDEAERSDNMLATLCICIAAGIRDAEARGEARGREAGLEEAAWIAEAEAQRQHGLYEDQDGPMAVAQNIAAAIRARGAKGGGG